MEIYTVRPGDSLWSLSRRFGVSTEELAYINQLSDPSRLVPGMALTVSLSPGKMLPAEVNAYAYPNIASSVLAEYLPALSWICPFTHMCDENGQLSALRDEGIRRQAEENGCAVLLSIANLDPAGGFSSRIAHSILTQEQPQQAFIENSLALLKEKNCYGVNLDFEYVYPFDRDSYSQFLRLYSDILHREGYIFTTAVAPKISDGQQGLLYAAHDYAAHGQYTDRCVIMTYEWGYLYGAPQAVSPVDKMRQVLDYAVSRINPGKILMGFSNYGYNWKLPWKQGDAASIISNAAAMNLAAAQGAEIHFDRLAQAPYFNYTDSMGQRHVVWFEDARSVAARLQLVEEYSLAGISIWNINQLWRAIELLTQSMYSIEKFI